MRERISLLHPLLAALCFVLTLAASNGSHEDAVYNRMLTAGQPAWIVPIELPDEAPPGFRLFSVNAGADS